MKGKKGYIIGLSLVILVFGIWVINEFKNRKNLVIQPDKMSGLKESPHQEKNNKKDDQVELDYFEIAEEKIKAPDFAFINQNKDTVSNKDFEGKVYVIEFFYTTCPTICPVMNDNLLEISEEFETNDKFGIASFTIDPDHDTPDVLKEYAEDLGVKQPHWHFLTGAQEDIFNLAEQDFKMIAQKSEDEPGGIIHDGYFFLIDKEGYVRTRKDEFGNPVIYNGHIERDATPDMDQGEPNMDELIEDIKTLLHEPDPQ